MDVEKIVTVYAWDSDAIHSIYRHYLYRIASLSYKEKQSCYANSFCFYFLFRLLGLIIQIDN